MLHYLGLAFPCTQGMAKYLEPSHGVLEDPEDFKTIPRKIDPASSHGVLEDPEDFKTIYKQIDLATVDTVDTLPQLNLLDNVSTRDISDYSVTSAEALQHALSQSITDAAQIQEWRGDYDMVKTLQQAPRNQGRVDLMRSVQTGRFAAVKRMPNSWITSGPDEFDSAHPDSSERPWFDIGMVKFLHQSAFEHVCEPWGVFTDGLDTYVVSSYASEGELFSWLERDPAPGPEREALVRPMMRQLFLAVKWLHDLGVAHCDISLENVLLADEGAGPIVKLIDFGMATLDRNSTIACGKKSYMAPEMYSNEPFDVFATDAFALGVVAFSVCCREYPWNSTKPGTCKLFEYVRNHGLQNFMEKRKVYGSKDPHRRLANVISKPLQTILAGLLQMAPKTRMTLGEEQADVQTASVWSGSDWFEASQ